MDDPDKKWSDIGYSYLLDPDDLVWYEGRGAGALGAHTSGRNRFSHGLCVMGNYETGQVQAGVVDAVAEMIVFGHERGWWPNALTGGHKDVVATLCPGKHLYPLIPEINRRAGGSPTAADPDGPDPYVIRIQKAIIRAGVDLPEFGADGFPGPETASGADQLADRYLALMDAKGKVDQKVTQLSRQVLQLQQRLERTERSAAAGELLRQAITALEE